ncbi:response regulator transcription factor [Oscillochloris sp. ZM17-4]|uniref:response regulator transcription factor n=1 Tax=Oscillochloris sp. ZM17-4 TaxID=2866714 RepID=UPI001C736FCA|nr:response regulator transcription factor [Oscillochloris sp. ZM17-4]MBX0328549.1 response regulator transcription factor [Oscillochloris sp. ZM17-4]
MTRIFIIAPTPALRAGLRAIIAGQDLEVVGEAAGAIIAPTADVIVAAGDDPAATARAMARDEGAALVLLSDDLRLAGVLRDLPLRGWAIIPPDASGEELRAAAMAAAQGLVALPQSMAGQISSPRLAEPQGDPLTGRELEVLALLSQGLPNKQIAGRLQISEHTVKFHISSIFTKLNAASRTEAVSIGARQGLIVL